MRGAHGVLMLAMVAAVALAVPTAAQAEGPFWYVNNQKLAGVEEFSAEGELSFKVPLGESSFQVGPCQAQVGGTLANDAKAAAGTVNGLTMSTPCGTSLFGCYVSSVKPTNLPWSIAAEAGKVVMQDLALNVATMGMCKIYGVPSNSFLKGPLRGGWRGETECLEYKEAGELLVVGPEKPVYTNGDLCLSVPKGTLALK
jgi:hypothetical protein